MSDEFSQCRWPMMPFHQKATSNSTEFVRVQASLWEFQEDVEADFLEFRANISKLGFRDPDLRDPSFRKWAG